MQIVATIPAAACTTCPSHPARFCSGQPLKAQVGTMLMGDKIEISEPMIDAATAAEKDANELDRELYNLAKIDDADVVQRKGGLAARLRAALAQDPLAADRGARGLLRADLERSDDRRGRRCERP